MLENRRSQIAAMNGSSKFVGRSDDGRDARRDIFSVEARCDLAIDQQAVVAQHDGRVHAIPLANGRHQVSNVRHSSFRSEVVAKLRSAIAEVKRLQSLELCRTLP